MDKPPSSSLSCVSGSAWLNELISSPLEQLWQLEKRPGSIELGPILAKFSLSAHVAFHFVVQKIVDYAESGL